MTADADLAAKLDRLDALCEHANIWRDAAESIRRLSAENVALRAELAAIKAQKPVAWYVPDQAIDWRDEVRQAAEILRATKRSPDQQEALDVLDTLPRPTAASTTQGADAGDLLMALRVAYRLLDGSQPIDVPGARMVLQSAIKGGPTAWFYDISPPPGFIDYVKGNYSGEVVFIDPEWHALRLWNAAMKNAKPPFVCAHAQKGSTE